MLQIAMFSLIKLIENIDYQLALTSIIGHVT
jgi:hypothetical protein